MTDTIKRKLQKHNSYIKNKDENKNKRIYLKVLAFLNEDHLDQFRNAWLESHANEVAIYIKYGMDHKIKYTVSKSSRSVRKFLSSIKGKLYSGARFDRRKRNFKSELINDWFEGCERHHINKNQIICIPKEIHRKYYHDICIPNTMILINRYAFAYLIYDIKTLE